MTSDRIAMGGTARQVYLAYGLRIRSALELPGIRRLSGRDHDETATVDRAVDIEFAPIDDAAPERGDWCRLAPQDSVIVKDGIGAIRVRDGRRIQVQAAPGAEPELAQYVLGPAMGLLLQQRGLFCLHASCVQVGEGAVAFAGDSGVGKSTLAHSMRAAGHALVADDIVAIDDSAGVPVVHPGHVVLRLAADDMVRAGVDPERFEPVYPGSPKRLLPVPDDACVAAALPLDRVYVVVPGSRVGVEELTGLERSLALLRCCFFPELLGGVTGASALMQQCVRIADRTRVLRLHRRDDLDSLPALLASITGGSASRGSAGPGSG